MAAITISRQTGSWGARIARRLARELGWEYADKSTINQVIGQYGLVRLNKIYDEVPRLSELFDDNSTLTIEMMNDTIRAIAARGEVVLLGRGAFVVMKDVADVLNVFIQAPLEVRIERVAEREKIDIDAAAEQVKRDDKMRRRFTRLYYGANWAKPENYDLVVDTGDLTDADAIETIVGALHALPARAQDADTAEAIPVHPILAATIEEVMGSKPVR